MTFSHSIFDSFSDLKSRQLTNCVGLVLHPITGLPDLAHPIEISFELEGINLSICGASDGESIEVAHEKIDESNQIDMDDLGITKIDNFSEIEPYREYIGPSVNQMDYERKK